MKTSLFDIQVNGLQASIFSRAICLRLTSGLPWMGWPHMKPDGFS